MQDRIRLSMKGIDQKNGQSKNQMTNKIKVEEQQNYR
jgi:hypothetical protein